MRVLLRSPKAIAAQLTQKIEPNDVDGREIQGDDAYTASIPAPWMQHIDHELVDTDPDSEGERQLLHRPSGWHPVLAG